MHERGKTLRLCSPYLHDITARLGFVGKRARVLNPFISSINMRLKDPWAVLTALFLDLAWMSMRRIMAVGRLDSH